jgi:hypothetical protein
MRKPVPILIVILVAAVSWIFFKNFRLAGWNELRVVPRHGAANGMRAAGDSTTAKAAANSKTHAGAATSPDKIPRIRIASFNVQSLDTTKSRKPHVLDLLARIGRQFDCLALQEIESASDDVLPRLIHLMNSTGQSYDYAIGPRVGPDGQRQQYAFVFNTQTVVLDRKELYTVDDRDDLLAYEPLVGWFRAVGPPANEAFTFSLINVRIQAETALQERDYLANLLFAVRNDGRQEDDIILAGDLQGAPGQLGSLDRIADLVFAVTQTPTDVAGIEAWDNLVFARAATGEYTGDSGVFDFLRKYNLPLDEAAEVSDHLPVWAEFLIYEGGEAGRVAQQPRAARIGR